MRCNVCEASLDEPIYESPSAQALTSLCELRDGRVRVWCCAACGHLLGQPLEQTREYYATEYRISLDHRDEDQIYEVRDGVIVYRTEHQFEVLRGKVDFSAGAMVLDHGCAKAATPRRLGDWRPDLRIHLFDVSTMYAGYWDGFVPPERRAVHETPPDWAGRFDVVTSFFALEHIPSPLDTARDLAALLRPGGTLYAVVPDTFGNVADFVVIDHVNHFTASSIATLLERAGFEGVTIDAQAHRGALVVVARRAAALAVPAEAAARAAAAAAVREESLRLAAYWTELAGHLHRAAQRHAGRDIAIYGSGFYGALIYTALPDPSRVRCFLDQSPFQQGKMLFGRPVLRPEALPEDVTLLFVGLNPGIARAAIGALDWVRRRGIDTVFLDGADA